MDGKGKGGGDDHRPDQLEQNMPGGGDVGHPVDGGLLQELIPLPPHPVNGHSAKTRLVLTAKKFNGDGYL